MQIVKILPPVQRRYRSARDRPEQREVQAIDVEMQDVELFGALAHPVEHQHVVRHRIAHVGVKPQRAARATDELRRCDRIAAREQSDVMPLPDQFFSELENDALGTPTAGRTLS